MGLHFAGGYEEGLRRSFWYSAVSAQTESFRGRRFPFCQPQQEAGEGAALGRDRAVYLGQADGAQGIAGHAVDPHRSALWDLRLAETKLESTA
jgi:hypothetical protein